MCAHEKNLCYGTLQEVYSVNRLRVFSLFLQFFDALFACWWLCSCLACCWLCSCLACCWLCFSRGHRTRVASCLLLHHWLFGCGFVSASSHHWLFGCGSVSDSSSVTLWLFTTPCVRFWPPPTPLLNIAPLREFTTTPSAVDEDWFSLSYACDCPQTVRQLPVQLVVLFAGGSWLS